MELDLQSLREEFGQHKRIPKKYEKEILLALSRYPELKRTRIQFKLAKEASVPYGTKPTLLSCFLPSRQRTYVVTILEKADKPEKDALLKKCTEEMRMAVLGHELAHVKQYSGRSAAQLLRMLLLYSTSDKKKRVIERNADKQTIKIGLGKELLAHARYLRSIPGYLEQRPELNQYYLLPDEIEYYLQHPDKIRIRHID